LINIEEGLNIMKTRTLVTAVFAIVLLALPVLHAQEKAEPVKITFNPPLLTPVDFNRIAVQAGVGLFWYTDVKNPGIPDPDEFMALGAGETTDKYVTGGRFTKLFETTWRKLVDMKRRETVRKELDQGIPTLVSTDLSSANPADKKFASKIFKVVQMIDRLHEKQSGAAGFEAKLVQADPESRAMFRRNQGPWCYAPITENDPFCNALADFPKQKWDTYPSDGQSTELCKKLAALPNGKDLMSPFAVVRKEGEGFAAVPYNKAYGTEMKAVALELRAAAALLDQAKEGMLYKYLLAAADAFESNQWEAADEAWAAMNAKNSAWYLRVAPDEVYWDLCQEKAGFQLTYALIDRSSLEVQEKLTPLRDDMEHMLSMLSRGTYKARQVAFQMPDFIEIIANAGDARSPIGATIGQSLPNWGKVAAEGRGRTVVMTNLYQDPQSKRLSREKASALLMPATMINYVEDKLTNVYDIVLHEATHNLGPHSDYKIDGKGPSEIFGGPLASTIEELKAQTGALYYTELLRKKGVISDDRARQIYTHSIVWAFGHISQGMFAPSGNPKTYSQLAAVQVGYLMEEGALGWELTADPSTGKTTGKFDIRYEMLVPAIEKLMEKVVKIKATGDVQGARALVEPYVSGDRRVLVHMEEITERLLKFPRASMVYSVKF
jgi:hypothetical protein